LGLECSEEEGGLKGETTVAVEDLLWLLEWDLRMAEDHENCDGLGTVKGCRAGFRGWLGRSGAAKEREEDGGKEQPTT
jgi:hypothetical protein